MLTMYLGVLDKFLADLIPLALGWLALRRFVLSRSNNRIILFVALLHCITALCVGTLAQGDGRVLRVFAHLLAYSTIVLWIFVLQVTGSTRMALSYSRPIRSQFHSSREGRLAGD